MVGTTSSDLAECIECSDRKHESQFSITISHEYVCPDCLRANPENFKILEYADKIDPDKLS